MRRERGRRRYAWFSFGLIALVTLAAGLVWYRQSAVATAEAERDRLAAAATRVTGLVERRLEDMRLRLALGASSAAAGTEITVTRLPLDGSDARVPLGSLMAAAGSGPDPGRPGLTAPYRLDGQWYAALVAPPDPRGTHAAIMPLAGLRLQLDTLARAQEVEVLVVSPVDRIWWTSPLDEAVLNLPAGAEQVGSGNQDAAAGRLAQWGDHRTVVRQTLPDYGLAVHVRPRPPAGSGIDYIHGALILATGIAGLVGCGVALRTAGSNRHRAARPAPAIPSGAGPPGAAPATRPVATRPAPARPTGPPAPGSAPAGSVPGIPFLAYAAQPDGNGGHEVVLHAMSQPSAFGLAADARCLPAKTMLERVADQQRREFEDYLTGKGHVDAAPAWLDWDVDSGNALVLQHFPFRRPGSEGRSPVPAGLLVSAEPQYQEWTRLEQSARESNAANTRKSRFLARLSHELRTPLNAIIGFAELMEHETLGPVGTPRYKDYLADIGASGRHLHELINDIIDISRVETGEMDLSESILPIRNELEACFRFIRERLEAAKLEFVFDVPDALPKLRADPLRFRQILLNLLSNAIKFTRPGGEVGISVRVTTDGSLRISVADTGIGMDEAGLRRAIEPFGRISDDQYGPTEGTGLGLPIARGLMALHGGRMEIESAPGAGTTVNLIFPPSRLIPAD